MSEIYKRTTFSMTRNDIQACHGVNKGEKKMRKTQLYDEFNSLEYQALMEGGCASMLKHIGELSDTEYTLWQENYRMQRDKGAYSRPHIDNLPAGEYPLAQLNDMIVERFNCAYEDYLEDRLIYNPGG